MIRAIEPRDIPHLQALGFTWNFASSDYLCGIVKCDEKDVPLQYMAAWAKAETHMGLRKYSTPAVRWADMQTMHAIFEQELARRGIREAFTFFERTERFCKRLFTLNWKQSALVSVHREVRSYGQ